MQQSSGMNELEANPPQERPTETVAPADSLTATL